MNDLPSEAQVRHHKRDHALDLERAYDKATDAYERAQDAANDAEEAMNRAWDAWQETPREEHDHALDETEAQILRDLRMANIVDVLKGHEGRDLDDAMCVVADQGLPNATVREVVAVLFEGCTDAERVEFEEGLDLDKTADAWLGECGQDLIEYALIAALIFTAIVAAVAGMEWLAG